MYDSNGDYLDRKRCFASDMRKRVLFVCVGNAYRSIIAEAYARIYLEDFDFESAGIRPLGYIPCEVLDVLQEDGIDTSGLYSKPIPLDRIREFDYIVVLSRIYFFAPEGTQVIFFDVEDPAFSTKEFLRKTRDMIKDIVLSLRSMLLSKSNTNYQS